MDLFTIGSGRKRNVDEAGLLAAFEDDRARGEGVSLENEDGSALFAGGEGFGPYTLEYFPFKGSGTHLRAVEELKKQEVRTAMVDYLHGGSSWRESYSWREVKDEKGGLVSVLKVLSRVAPWVLVAAGMVCVAHAATLSLFPGGPAGSAALWGFAGLICLILGVAYAMRNRFREAPGADGRKGERPHPLE